MNPAPTVLGLLPKVRAARVTAVLGAVDPAKPALAGVSGGRDSVLLLRLLAERGFRRVTVCHLDHRLRGAEARGDARFVGALSRRLGFAFAGAKADVARLAAESGQSMETAGRLARRDFFADAARKTGARTLFLGHHGDDRVETLLFNLLRGAGPRGLSSLRADAVQRFGRIRLRVVRPLLPVFRAEIDAAFAASGWEHREDSSNAVAGPLRNRLRLRVLPFIEKELGREVRGAIWRAAEILSEEEAWQESMVPPVGARLSVAGLELLAPALRRRTVAAWLKARGVADAGFEDVEAVCGLAWRERPAKINLSRGLHARRTRGTIWLQFPSPESKMVEETTEEER